MALLWTKWQRHTKVANRKRSPGKGALEVEKGDEKKKKTCKQTHQRFWQIKCQVETCGILSLIIVLPP